MSTVSDERLRVAVAEFDRTYVDLERAEAHMLGWARSLSDAVADGDNPKFVRSARSMYVESRARYRAARNAFQTAEREWSAAKAERELTA